jgi:hypothetical protein
MVHVQLLIYGGRTFYAPRQRYQFGQKQINRKECNDYSAGNRSASVEFISAGHTTDCYQFPRLGCFASVEFISAERTIESYKLLPIGLSQGKTMWLNSDRSMPSTFKLS